MIKVNLLPVKKKKKAKPVPGFAVAAFGITLAAAMVISYLAYSFNLRLESRRAKVDENEKTIEQLTQKIKSVENYEKLNSTYNQHKNIIETLGKNKTLPVKVLSEISTDLVPGVWLNTVDIKGPDINVNGTGFTNADVVNYIDNLKKSTLFTDVYLQETVQSQISGFSVYGFRVTYKVKS